MSGGVVLTFSVKEGYVPLLIIPLFVCLFVQEYRSEDVSDLYLEEREQQLAAAQDEKRKVQLSVPGMVNPHDMPEEMQD